MATAASTATTAPRRRVPPTLRPLIPAPPLQPELTPPVIEGPTVPARTAQAFRLRPDRPRGVRPCPEAGTARRPALRVCSRAPVGADDARIRGGRVDLQLSLVLAGLAIGVVVGMTGMGGGALMTPVLVLFFGIPPLAAVSSDLVVSAVMKPVGGLVHLRRGTVNVRLVGLLCLGSVPS